MNGFSAASPAGPSAAPREIGPLQKLPGILADINEDLRKAIDQLSAIVNQIGRPGLQPRTNNDNPQPPGIVGVFENVAVELHQRRVELRELVSQAGSLI